MDPSCTPRYRLTPRLGRLQTPGPNRRLLPRIVAPGLTYSARPSSTKKSSLESWGDDAAVVRSPGAQRPVDGSDDGCARLKACTSIAALSRRRADIGYRALAVNLSDLGGNGRRASVGAPFAGACRTPVAVDVTILMDFEVLAGSGAARGHAGCSGQPDPEPGTAGLDITAVGETRPRRTLTRSGGRPGDDVYVSGWVGAAAAGLGMPCAPRRRARVQGTTAAAASPAIGGRQLRVRLAREIAQAGPRRAAMDLQPRLGRCDWQLAGASECGVEIDA